MIIHNINILTNHKYSRRNFKNYSTNYNYNTPSFGATKRIDVNLDVVQSILQQAADNKIMITAKQIAEKLNINAATLKRRIYKNEKLKSMWNKVKSSDVTVFTKEENKLYSEAVGQILRTTEKNGEKISIVKIAEKVGISKNKITDIIYANEEYKNIFSKVRNSINTKKRTKEELNKEAELIKTILLNLQKNNMKISFKKLAAEIGTSIDSVYSRITNSKELKELWDSVKTEHPKKFTDAEKTINHNKLLDFFIEKEKQSTKIYLSDIVDYMGLSKDTIETMIKNNSQLKKFWKKLSAINMLTEKEKELLINNIHYFLTKRKELGMKATIKDISEHFDISQGFATKLINTEPFLKYQWNQLKSHSFRHFDKLEKRWQLEQIVEILKDAYTKKENITIKQIEKMTRLTPGVIKQRIRNNEQAKTLWEKIKNL